MKKTLLLLCFAFLCSTTAFGWGMVGHDAIAYIAECNLTPRAKKNIEKYLGHSIVYDGSWMDIYRHTPAYKHTSAWHTVNVDDEGNYESRTRGDAVQGIEEAMEALENYRNLDDSTVAVNVKYLIHLVGDMHCPMHVKYPGAKNFNIYLNGREYNYHSFWDTPVIELSHRWNYMEWGHQFDRCTKREKKAIAAGTPRDWMAQNARDCRIIYVWAQPEQRFGKDEARDFLNAVQPLAEQQILKAGYRLAAILNGLFG